MPTGTWEKIETKTLSSSGAFDFTAIPSTFTDLVITGQIRANGGSTVENAWFAFNGDYGSTSYGDMRGLAYAGGFTSDNTASTNQAGFGAISGAAATSGLFTSVFIHINNYASTNHFRPFLHAYIAYGYEANYRTGNWKNTSSAINQITFNCAGGSNFAPGSTLTIWGVKAS